MTDHAELRAMLEAQPEQQLYTYPPGGVLNRWVRESPALVRALLEERDQLLRKLADERLFGLQSESRPVIEQMRAERDALKAEVERLRETNNCLKANVAHVKAQRDAISNMLREDTEEIARLRAHPAEPISDELRLRCELAATVLPILAQWGKEHGIDGPFRDAVVNEAHNYAERLLAEGRGRMAAEREAKP